MNSHEHRTTERAWPHAINIVDWDLADECMAWCRLNFGSERLGRKRWPRWCWRPHYESVGNFSVEEDGIQLYFRKERDYTAFLLRWQQ